MNMMVGGMRKLIDVQGGAANALIGSEPTCGIAYSMAQAFISLCVSNKKRQDNTDGKGQAEGILRGSSWSAQAEEK